MFHPRCQKAHDSSMTSVPSEVRPRELHQTRRPKEGSLISCWPTCVRVSGVFVWFLCGALGACEATSQMVSFWPNTLPCFAAVLSVREEQ